MAGTLLDGALGSFHDLLESELAFLKFGIRDLKTHWKQLHLSMCGSLLLDYVSMNAVFDDVNGLQSGIRDFKRPFNTKNVVLADGSCDNL